MAALGLQLVGAVLAFFGGKVFSFGMTDHAEPGLRHVTPHVFLQRIFCAVGHSAALCRVGSVLIGLTHDLDIRHSPQGTATTAPC